MKVFGKDRKRARSDDELQFKLSKELQELTKLGKYASESSLTKEILIERLRGLGELEPVKVVEVRVQTLAAGSFSVQIDDKANSVGDLKNAIEESEGTRRYFLELYLVLKTKEKGKATGKAEASGSSESGALKDDRKLLEDCSVVLCKKVEAAWQRRRRECARRKAKLVCDKPGVLSGDCHNGYGKYQYGDGATYEGQWKRGTKHGTGTHIHPTGTKYVGQRQNGSKCGRGVLEQADGGMYDGEFLNGKKHGNGAYEFGDNGSPLSGWGWVQPGDKFEGNFVENREGWDWAMDAREGWQNGADRSDP